MTEAPVRSMRRPGSRPRPRTRKVSAKIRIVSICFGWLVGFSLILGAAERPKELVAFAERVRALPPEFAADLLLAMAEEQADVEWRKELAEEAFRLALRAPDIVPTRGGNHTDSRSAVTAAQHGLDILSLRMRAVRAMLRDDGDRAAAMFGETPLGALGTPTCASTQTPVLDVYYITMAMVHAKGFSARQRERGEPRQMVERAIAGLQTAAQVKPLGMALILVADPAKQEYLDAFGGALARVAPSDRIFGRDGVELLAIPMEVKRQGLRLDPLLTGLRAYVAAHLTGMRCRPNLAVGEGMWRAFNELAKGTEVPKLSEEQRKPEGDAGAWEEVDYWRSEKAREVLADGQWLNHGNRGLTGEKRFWTVEERNSQEWTGRYGDFLKKIEGWRESDEKATVDYRWMQSHTLGMAAKLVPPGPARDLAVRRWLTNFEGWYEPGASQNAWFGVLKRLLEERELVQGELRASRNPVVAAYAEWLSRNARK